MLIGTAGHIDHGKSALVRALTGVQTDRLKEEQARGISIELGYAYQPLPDGSVLAFVDVPGHQRFVRQMVAGATGIDFALLVVAADDGVMPQTIEHVGVLELLGLRHGAVAITKIDRADATRVQEVAAAVRHLLARTPLAAAPLFEVSNTTGAGIAALLAHLHAVARTFKRVEQPGAFRLAVDRSFTLAGAGTVVTGTVFAGHVAVGDELTVSPSGRSVRVRSLHAQARPAAIGVAGDRCALNLAGVSKEEVVRGDWIVAPVLHSPRQRFDFRVRALADAPRVLAQTTRVHLHCGAADLPARLDLLDRSELAPGGTAFAQVVLDTPHCVWHGDFVIVRDQSAACTLAGGRVLDPDPPARRRRSPERLALLALLEALNPADVLAALLHQSLHGVDLTRFARHFNVPIAALGLDEVSLRRVQTADVDVGFAPEQWSRLGGLVRSGLQAYHNEHGDELGVDSTRARRMWCPQLPVPVWRSLIGALIADQVIAQSGPWLHLPEHRVVLAPGDRILAERLLPLVDAGGFDPLWVRDLTRKVAAGEQPVRQVLRQLNRRGDLHQIVPDLFYSNRSIAALAAIAKQLAAEQGDITAAIFRDATQLGRKRAIQILEFFDRVGFTRRVGDAHRIRSDSLTVWADAGTVTPALAPASSEPDAPGPSTGSVASVAASNAHVAR